MLLGEGTVYVHVNTPADLFVKVPAVAGEVVKPHTHERDGADVRVTVLEYASFKVMSNATEVAMIPPLRPTPLRVDLVASTAPGVTVSVWDEVVLGGT
jgi:hypothetical protein